MRTKRNERLGRQPAAPRLGCYHSGHPDGQGFFVYIFVVGSGSKMKRGPNSSNSTAVRAREGGLPFASCHRSLFIFATTPNSDIPRRPERAHRSSCSCRSSRPFVGEAVGGGIFLRVKGDASAVIGAFGAPLWGIAWGETPGEGRGGPGGGGRRSLDRRAPRARGRFEGWEERRGETKGRTGQTWQLEMLCVKERR